MFSSFLCLRKEWEFYALAVKLSVLPHCSHWDMCGCGLNFLQTSKVQRSWSLNWSVLRADAHEKGKIKKSKIGTYIWVQIRVFIYLTCYQTTNFWSLWQEQMSCIACVELLRYWSHLRKSTPMALQPHLLVQSPWNQEKESLLYIHKMKQVPAWRLPSPTSWEINLNRF